MWVNVNFNKYYPCSSDYAACTRYKQTPLFISFILIRFQCILSFCGKENFLFYVLINHAAMTYYDGVDLLDFALYLLVLSLRAGHVCISCEGWNSWTFLLRLDRSCCLFHPPQHKQQSTFVQEDELFKISFQIPSLIAWYVLKPFPGFGSTCLHAHLTCCRWQKEVRGTLAE